MSNIHTWSTSATSNSSASPDGFPEAMPPSGVNDSAREVMAAVKRWYVDAEWRVYDLPAVRQTNNSFIVSATATDVFTAGRRFRGIDGGVTVYGDVVSSGASGANTLVTVSSSALSASLSQISIAILNPANRSDPDIGALTTTASVTASDYVEIFQSGTGLRRKALVPNAVRGAGLSLQAETDVSTGATSYTIASSVPAWVKRITVMFEGVSTNGNADVILQLGDAGGLETSGYLGGAADDASGTSATTGHLVSHATGGGGQTIHGSVTFILKDATNNTWVGTGIVYVNQLYLLAFSASVKSLSAVLTQVALTTVAGTATFDAGSTAVMLEG